MTSAVSMADSRLNYFGLRAAATDHSLWGNKGEIMKSALRILCILCLLGISTAMSARATAAGRQRADMFHWLFPNPSNNNGYEEFVRAAEMIQSMPEVNDVSSPGATLAFKRRVLGMSRVSKALSLVKDGLDKPVSPPRPSIDENTVFPEFAQFRTLTRLFSAEEYVNFADGHVDAAIKSLSTGLSFAYRIQMDTLIAGLVGIAMEAIVIRSFVEHIDSLSVYQCDEVVALMKQFLAAERPGAKIMAMEKAGVIKMLDVRRSDPDSLLKLLGDISAGSPPQQVNDVALLRSYLLSDPGQVAQAISAAQARVAAMCDQAAANMNLPVSQRKAQARDESTAPGDIIFRAVVPNLDQILNRYDASDAMYRLLALHALIRRYRWDHNALPANLEVLKADDLIVDPFTCGKIIYKPDKDRYELYSAGPNAMDEATNELTGPRVPVRL
jgi:hypothetical protein